MERFVQLIVAGGLTLVAGLWLVRLFEPTTIVWVLGGVLAFFGVAGLAKGIWIELAVHR